MRATIAGAAAILGVLCAGVLLEAFSWESVFGLNVVLAALALVVVQSCRSADEDAPRLDRGGAALAVVGTVSLSYIRSSRRLRSVGWRLAR